MDFGIRIFFTAALLAALPVASGASEGQVVDQAQPVTEEIRDRAMEQACPEGDCMSDHEGCLEERPDPRGGWYPPERYCCKHDGNGHHVCQWYSYHCTWAKVGDTWYYVCYYKATGEAKQTYCINSP